MPGPRYTRRKRPMKTIAGIPVQEVKRVKRAPKKKAAPAPAPPKPKGNTVFSRPTAPAFKRQETQAKKRTKRARAKVPKAPTTAPGLPPRRTPAAMTPFKGGRGPAIGKLLKGAGISDKKFERSLRAQKPSDLKIAGINIDSATGKVSRGAIDVLEETLRPNYAIAGATRAALRGENVVKAAERGIKKQDTYTFSDVLKQAKVGEKLAPVLAQSIAPVGTKGKQSKGAADVIDSALGFGLDVATDPTTYVTAGTASVARQGAAKAGVKTVAKRTAAREAGKLPMPKLKQTGAGQKAAKKTYRKARVAGKSPAEAKAAATTARQARDEGRQARRVRTLDSRAGRRAEQRVMDRLPDAKGVQVGFGPLRTSGRTTERLARPLRGSDGGRRYSRELGSTFSPHIRPAGVAQQDFDTLKAASREARATAARGRSRALSRAAAIAKELPPEKAGDVIDAIERGTVYTLPKPLQEVGQAIERELKQARRAEIKAGIKTAQVSNTRYFTHLLNELAGEVAKGAKGVRGGGGRTIRAGYAKQRQWRGTIRQIEEAGGPEFSKNVPLVLADRLARSAEDVGRANLASAVGKIGREIKPGSGDLHLADGEGVFHVEHGKVTPLNIRDSETKRLLGRVGSGDFKGEGKFIVADEAFVNRQIRGAAPTSDYGVIRKAFDKTTGGFKWAVTVPNPGFHVRNLMGDTANAWLGQSAPQLAASTVDAGRVLRRVGRREQAAAKTLTGEPKPLAGKVMVKDRHGRKQAVTLEQLGREAERHGAIRQGFIGRELPELWHEGPAGVTKVRSGRGAAVSRQVGRVLQSREDLLRLATYIGARKRGMSAQEAAKKVTIHHFDYGDLSPFEREVMRRLLPFYTFSSRNIALQTKGLLSRPGKYATVEKAREELARAQGIDLQEWEADLKPYQLHGVPFPIKVGDDVYAIGSQNMLPLTDLAKIPFPGVGWDTTMQTWIDTFGGLLNPLIRTPIELIANYNFFFKGPIERDQSPLVSAPSFVGKFPKAVRERLGIVSDFIDKKTGKKTWGWPAKVDYVSKVVTPGPVGAVARFSDEGESPGGQSRPERALSYFGGVRAERVDPEGARIGRLLDEWKTLSKKRAALGQRGIGSSRSGRRETKEYRDVRDRIAAIEEAVTGLSTKRGDVIPLFRRSSGGGSGSGDPLGIGGGSQSADPLGLSGGSSGGDPLGLGG